MADAAELVLGICELIKTSPKPIPITLMNHPAKLASGIIVAVVEKCSRDGIELKRVCIDPNWSQDLGFTEGMRVSKYSDATVKCETGLGRQILFNR